MKNDKDSRRITTQIRNKTSTNKYFAPQNYEEEKRKFFISDSYNPLFEYEELPIEYFLKSLETIESTRINPETSIENVIENNRLLETKYKLELLIARGDAEKITTISEKLYQCTFAQKYVEKAKNIAENSASFNENSVEPQEIKKSFNKYLKKYDITDWEIKISKRKDFNIQVRYKKEIIRISESINLDFASLDSLLAHEIDGHVLRAINAANQKLTKLKDPLPFYIKTEEGLASYLGDHFAQNGKLSKKHHAIKYLGAYIALHHSFREVYNFFLDNGFTSDLAFQRAVRIKKGFTDTSVPGCNAREAIYWEGMLDVRDYLESGGDINKLYAGKIGLADINYLPESEDVVLPQRIQT